MMAGEKSERAEKVNPEIKSLYQVMLRLAEMYMATNPEGGLSPQATDAITQELLLILGSGPALAAYDGLLQAQAANGLMYHNAVANQQKATMLGMAMTAKCVRYMTEGQYELEDELEAELNAELNS